LSHSASPIRELLKIEKLSFFQKGGVLKVKSLIQLGVVVHTCNSSYTGGEDQEDCVLSQHRQKVREIQSQQTSLGWLSLSVIPDVRSKGTKAEGSLPEAWER
jgi:hypothetical protein